MMEKRAANGAHQPAEGAPGEGEAGNKDTDEDDHGVCRLLRNGGAREGETCQRRSGRLHHEHGDAGHKEQRLAAKSVAESK